MIIYDPKITGSFQINGSTISSVGEIDNLSGSVAALNNASSSYLLNTTDVLNGNLTVTGTLTAQEFYTEYTSASIVYQSGSTKFGDTSDDVHEFTGKIGIGVASPAYTLDVNGNARIDSTLTVADAGTATSFIYLLSSPTGESELRMGDTDTDAGSIAYSNNTDTMVFRAGAANRVFINSNGNVGIGTTSPTGTYGKLTVNGSISLLDDQNTKLEIGRYSAGASNSYIKLGANSNSLRITNNTDTADLLYINNDGSVLIGQATKRDQEKFAVVGTTANYLAEIRETGTGGAENSGLLIYYPSSAPNSRSKHFLLNADNTATKSFLSSDGGAYFSGDVGIGDSTPNFVTSGRRVLELNGSSEALMSFAINGSWQYYIQTTTSGIFHSTGGKDFIIDPGSSNVGIGITSPQHKLDIQDSTATILLRGTNNSVAAGDVQGSILFYNNDASTAGGARVTGAIKYVTQDAFGRHALVFGTSTTDTKANFGDPGTYTDSTIERMRITHEGNTQYSFNPQGGTVYWQDVANGASMFYLIPAPYVGTAPYNKNRIVAANSSHIAFETGGAEQMAIDSSGFITTNPSANIQGALVAKGVEYSIKSVGSQTGYTQGAIVLSSGTDSVPGARGQGIFLFNEGNDTTWYAGSLYNSADRFDICRASSTTSVATYAAQSTYSLFHLNNGGSAYNATGTWGTISSDQRLKENIVNATPKLNDVMSLQVRNFNYIGKEEKFIGFIAQELEQVFPSLVTTSDMREFDRDGNVIGGLEDTKGVKVGMDFAILVKAIQEQQAIIEDLKARIQTLENS